MLNSSKISFPKGDPDFSDYYLYSNQGLYPMNLQKEFYKSNRPWGDLFLPVVNAIAWPILGALLAVTSSFIQDTHDSFDVLMPETHLSVRIRRPEYIQYKKELTLRCSVPSDSKTEFEKIVIDGKAGYYFYGFASPDNKGLQWWWLLRMKSFQRQMLHELISPVKKIKCGEKRNPDGTTFAHFDITSFDPDFVISSGSYYLPDM